MASLEPSKDEIELLACIPLDIEDTPSLPESPPTTSTSACSDETGNSSGLHILPVRNRAVAIDSRTNFRPIEWLHSVEPSIEPSNRLSIRSGRVHPKRYVGHQSVGLTFARHKHVRDRARKGLGSFPKWEQLEEKRLMDEAIASSIPSAIRNPLSQRGAVSGGVMRPSGPSKVLPNGETAPLARGVQIWPWPYKRFRTPPSSYAETDNSSEAQLWRHRRINAEQLQPVELPQHVLRTITPVSRRTIPTRAIFPTRTTASISARKPFTSKTTRQLQIILNRFTEYVKLDSEPEDNNPWSTIESYKDWFARAKKEVMTWAKAKWSASPFWTRNEREFEVRIQREWTERKEKRARVVASGGPGGETCLVADGFADIYLELGNCS